MVEYSLLPKVELHVHLDSSLSFEFVKKHKSLSQDEFNARFKANGTQSLTEYLEYIKEQINILQNENQLRDSIIDIFQQFKNDNVLYAEIRFCPLLHTSEGLNPNDVLEIITNQVIECENKSGIHCNIILTTLREFSHYQSIEILELARKFLNKKVVAIDIASDESKYSIKNHIKTFSKASKLGIKKVAHAGEAKGPDSVWNAINNIKPLRIGHGVRSIEDKSLVNYLIRNKIHLEICPSSNLRTGIYHTISDHPVSKLYEFGVSLGINTDGRTTANTSLNNEYKLLADCFKWGKSEFLKCNIHALDASFVEHKIKLGLQEKIINDYGT